MSARVVGGPRVIGMSRDVEGHREYTAVYRVECNTNEGPLTVSKAQGLIAPGEPWNFGVETDQWAYCTQEAKVTSLTPGEPSTQYDVELKFSSKPQPPSKQRCSDNPIEDPLLEPPKISGSFTKHKEEAVLDRFGFPVVNSAWELIRGPQNEWDHNRPNVKIEQNVRALNLPALSALIDCVNISDMWGLPPRTIKLSSVSWDRKFYGHCSIYFSRTLEFDINMETFDRDLLDEGTKVLNGHFDRTTGRWIIDKVPNASGRWPSRFLPSDFIRYKDKQGENTRVVLNGYGLPAGVTMCSDPLDVPKVVFEFARDDEAWWISKTNNNLGNPLGDDANWLPIHNVLVQVTPSTVVNWPLTAVSPPIWSRNSAYIVGDVVKVDSSYYVCVQNTIADPRRVPTGIHDVVWALVNAPMKKGAFSMTTTYGTGNYVQILLPSVDVGTSPTCFTTGIGTRHVEKYPSADLSVLGIPDNL